MTYYADKIYIHAKIFPLFKGLLKKHDYAEIINTKNFHSILPEIPPDLPGGDYLAFKETVFKHQISKIILMTGANRHYHRLFRAFLSLFEITNVKMLLARSSGIRSFSSQWNDTGPYSVLDRSLLDDDLSTKELAAALKNTPYNHVLSPDKDEPYEVTESRCDFVSLINITRMYRTLPPSDRPIFLDLMMRRFAILRSLWALRLLHFYEWDRESISLFLNGETALYPDIHAYGRRYAAAEKETARVINRFYADRKEISRDGLSEAEIVLEVHFLKTMMRMMRRDFHALYPVISYLWLVYYQIRNLFAVIEGLHFRMAPEKILKKIVTGD